MSVAISLRHCAKTFGSTRALEPLDLEIPAGTTTVLLGPSGCGKTTTLRMIAGLEHPDGDGRVFFGEEDVTAVPIHRRNVGIVFQHFALFPTMTVAENIAYGLRVRHLSLAQREERVDAMLALMRIEDLAHRAVTKLSGGQKQRVACAIAPQPRVLLFDEPLAALDAQLRQRLRVEIDELLNGLGTTAVYVTHDQAEALALGDRIVVMNDGRIEQVGTPREIYEAPATAFVADFVGTVNRLSESTGNVRLVRPEQIRIVEPSEGPYVGIVTHAYYQGSRVRVAIRLEAGDDVIADVDPATNTSIGRLVGLSIVSLSSAALPALS